MHRLAGWTFYAPGRLVLCPNQNCGHGMGESGLGLITQVRILQSDGGTKPTHFHGYSQRCKHCRKHVEYLFDFAVPARMAS